MDFLKFLVGIIAIVRAWLDRRQSADDRAAGRAEANAETLGKNADAVRQANEAEIEAQREHATAPGDDAFDQEFRRP